jgi:hypothetical protein
LKTSVPILQPLIFDFTFDRVSFAHRVSALGSPALAFDELAPAAALPATGQALSLHPDDARREAGVLKANLVRHPL